MAGMGGTPKQIAALSAAMIAAGALYMVVLAPRFESPTVVRYAAPVGPDALLVYEVNLSGSGRIRRWGRLVVLELATGAERARTTSLDGEPMSSSDDAVWMWDARRRALSTVSLPGLQPGRSWETLQRELPPLASGIVSAVPCERPCSIRLTTQTGDYYGLSLRPVGIAREVDTRCKDEEHPSHTVRLKPEKGSERMGLVRAGEGQLLGTARWLAPKLIDDLDGLDGDVLITSMQRMTDRNPSWLSRVGVDGTERWRVGIQSAVHKVFSRQGLLVLITGATVRALDAKTGAQRWVRNP